MCVFEFECEGMGVGKCLYDTKEVENPAMCKRLPVALHLPRDSHGQKKTQKVKKTPRPCDTVLPPTVSTRHMLQGLVSIDAKMIYFEGPKK